MVIVFLINSMHATYKTIDSIFYINILLYIISVYQII